MTFKAMKWLQPIIIMFCLVAFFAAHAGEQIPAVELQPLQGTWKGVLVGHETDGNITITITANSLHFHRDTNFWFETTFTLPAGKDPKQLHATIKDCPPAQAKSIGQIVRAFFKIENGILTLATLGDDSEETPRGFEAAGDRYELRRVQPPDRNIESPKTKNIKKA